jgi:hypothetical protein
MVCNKITPFFLQNLKPTFEIQNEALLTISISYESLIDFQSPSCSHFLELKWKFSKKNWKLGYIIMTHGIIL